MAGPRNRKVRVNTTALPTNFRLRFTLVRRMMHMEPASRHTKAMKPKMRIVQRQPLLLMMGCAMRGKINVPMPDPDTARPVAYQR